MVETFTHPIEDGLVAMGTIRDPDRRFAALLALMYAHDSFRANTDERISEMFEVPAERWVQIMGDGEGFARKAAMVDRRERIR